MPNEICILYTSYELFYITHDIDYAELALIIWKRPVLSQCKMTGISKYISYSLKHPEHE